MKVGFIGLGKLGYPCAKVMSDFGHNVYGYDIEQREEAKSFIGGFIQMENSIKDVVEKSAIVFVAVPTPHSPEYDGSLPTSSLEPKDFDYSIVKSVLAEINKYADGTLVSLISTVLPGTIREQLLPLVPNCTFIYNPYLIAMGTVEDDMIDPEMVMIGTASGDPYSSDARSVIRFYKSIVEKVAESLVNKGSLTGGERGDFDWYVVGTYEEIECVKVFYNTFISSKISFVNMIQDVAVRLGNIDVDVVTSALTKGTTRVISPAYMTAGMGDGGACHPRDNIALRFLAQKLDLGYDIFSSVMGSREVQAKNMAKYLVDLAEEKNLPIVIHGKAYKPLVEYVDGSYSLLVGYYCEQYGKTVTYVDKCTGDVRDSNEPALFLLAHSATTTYRYWDDAPGDEMYCEIPEGSVVVDPWRKFSSDNLEVIHYGNTRTIAK